MAASSHISQARKTGKSVQSQPSSVTSCLNLLRQHGEALLDEQMWCWGCDVRHIPENLLVAYGCLKRPSPLPRYHSAYSCWLQPDVALTVWGWGVWIAAAEHGSLFLSRSRFRLGYQASAEYVPLAWQEKQLPGLDGIDAANICAVLHLLGLSFGWIAGYERWLAGHIAAEYRAQTVANWPQQRQLKGVPAAAMADAWETLAARCTAGWLVQPVQEQSA